ncbi:MAG TPA: 2OG-Fe dioxygenase family protein [Polyangiaceae bacterium]|jgi:hypothetical protein
MFAVPPPTVPLARLDDELRDQGLAVLSPSDLRALAAADEASLGRLAAYWDDLPLDAHLRDGGRYRRRRHGSFVVEGGAVTLCPHRAHWQPLDYNALHGGIERWFAPIAPAMLAEPVWSRLLAGLAGHADRLRGAQRWFVEAHPFRIETVGGIGRPTPEGAHRDGVDLVAVILIARHAVRGGETRVFEADGPRGNRFLLTDPWTTVLLDDARVVHETTPIQPLREAPEDAAGHRDTLVVTFRAGGFQSPPAGVTAARRAP